VQHYLIEFLQDLGLVQPEVRHEDHHGGVVRLFEVKELIRTLGRNLEGTPEVVQSAEN
jgi:hypothetical protein